MGYRIPQKLNPEPIQHCKLLPETGKCTYPLCNCYDAENISSAEADALLIKHLEPMLERLRSTLNELKYLIANDRYLPYQQLKVYRKRRARLQKNFIFLKIKYDMIAHNKK